MIAQWDSSLSVLPVARVRFPATAEYFKGFFPDWSHSANPSWASVAENGSISSQRHHTTCGQWGGRPKFNNGQTMADRKKDRVLGSEMRSQHPKCLAAFNCAYHIHVTASEIVYLTDWKHASSPKVELLRHPLSACIKKYANIHFSSNFETSTTI